MPGPLARSARAFLLGADLAHPHARTFHHPEQLGARHVVERVVWDLAEVKAWLRARRAVPIRRAKLAMQVAKDRSCQSAGSGSKAVIVGGISTMERLLPSTQASTTSDHSCIIWRRWISYSALL